MNIATPSAVVKMPPKNQMANNPPNVGNAQFEMCSLSSPIINPQQATTINANIKITVFS